MAAQGLTSHKSLRIMTIKGVYMVYIIKLAPFFGNLNFFPETKITDNFIS